MKPAITRWNLAPLKPHGAPPQRGRPRKGEGFRFAFVLPAEAAPFNEQVDRLIAQAAACEVGQLHFRL